MIGDHPWLGCGPGQFQDYFTAYKLPQASETPSDPHNFLLEIGASEGIPAALSFMLMLALYAWEARPGIPAEDDTAHPPMRTGEDHGIHAGALAGVGLAYGAGLAVGFMPEVAIVLVGLPVAGICAWLLRSWRSRGLLAQGPVVIAWLVLCINLLAAGGISLPGVAGSFWILTAIGLRGSQRARHALVLSRGATLPLVVLACALLMGCYLTTYAPVLGGLGHMAAGRSSHLQGRRDLELGRLESAQRHLARAAEEFRRATESDPLAASAWMQLASVLGDKRQQWADAADGRAFDRALQTALRLQPRSAAAHVRAGTWYLASYRRSGRIEELDAAIGCLSRAAELYPSDSFIRAQLAWTLHVRGRAQDSSREARSALALDAQTAHAERKLRVKRIVDPLGPGESGRSPSVLPGGASAEEMMRYLE
jgi:tetratricopeptide (TPR) repeat protein